ncbi:DExH-box splicing factor binding site-domain-containing protein [Lactarius sanguifluus]|nr:DExH-box splicing factor binding site-domain-containing protein [Lactarius sanguifluus]
MSTKVSFTVRRPTPESRAPSAGPDSDDPRFKVPALPRHLVNDHSASNSSPGSPLAGNSPKRRAPDNADSSDEDENGPTDELVTGFDRFGVQRVTPRPEPQGPLVIPALKNRDWRELARRRRAGAGGQMYVPPAGQAGIGADGSVGGLGTRDTINSGPQVKGLQLRKRKRLDTADDMAVELEPSPSDVTTEEPEESEDQRAIRALLAGTGGDDGHEGPVVDTIPLTNGSARRGPTEDDAFKQDVDELPNNASLADYERVPVAQFGAALLRGMGWKPGEPASRNKKRGIVEPWLPASRPALLGIGAKEREALDDGSGGRRGPSRPERKYVPLLRRESSDRSSPLSQPPSRSDSRMASPSSSERERRDSTDTRDRRRDRDRERERDRNRERERDGRDGDRKTEREMDRDRHRDGRDKTRQRERSPRSSQQDPGRRGR